MTPQETINWIRLDIDMAKFDPSTGEEAYLNDDAKKVIEAMEMAIDALSKQAERASLSEQEKSNSFPEKPSEDGESEMNSTKFKSGDKFILELGAERRMFGEFEIAGTDLYVKTDLLEKLTRYEPNAEPVTNSHDLVNEPEIIHCKDCKHYNFTFCNVLAGLGFRSVSLYEDGRCEKAERRNDG